MAYRMQPAPARDSMRWTLGVVLSVVGILIPVFFWSLIADWLAGGTRPVDVLAKIGYFLSALVVVMFVLRVLSSLVGSSL